MSHDVSWIIPDKVLYMDISGVVDTKEAVAINRLNRDMAKASSTPPVHAIIDGRRIEDVKFKISDVTHAIEATDGKFMGWTVIITDNRFVKFMSAVFSKVAGVRYVTVSTLDEAAQLLQKKVPGLELPAMTEASSDASAQ